MKNCDDGCFWSHHRHIAFNPQHRKNFLLFRLPAHDVARIIRAAALLHSDLWGMGRAGAQPVSNFLIIFEASIR